MENLKALTLIGMLMLLPSPLWAVTIYKVIDANGKVTYQNQPPPKAAGRVEVKEIDTEQNVLPAVVNQAPTAKTVGRPQAGDTAGVSNPIPNPTNVIDNLVKRNYDTGIAAATEEAARNGKDYNGIAGTELEDLGAPPVITPVAPPVRSAPMPLAKPGAPTR